MISRTRIRILSTKAGRGFNMVASKKRLTKEMQRVLDSLGDLRDDEVACIMATGLFVHLEVIGDRVITSRVIGYIESAMAEHIEQLEKSRQDGSGDSDVTWH